MRHRVALLFPDTLFHFSSRRIPYSVVRLYFRVNDAHRRLEHGSTDTELLKRMMNEALNSSHAAPTPARDPAPRRLTLTDLRCTRPDGPVPTEYSNQ